MRILDQYDERFERARVGIENSRIEDFVDLLCSYKEKEENIVIMGNGGSMSLAAHFAEDLNKGIVTDPEDLNEKRFRAIALSDVAALTAYGNDISYNKVFSELSINYLNKGGLAIVISASGNSPNIVEAVRVLKETPARTFGILGFDGGQVKDILDDYILVRTEPKDYRVAEDLHLHVVHKVIEVLEKKYLPEKFAF